MPESSAPHLDVAGYVLGVLDPAESAHFAGHLRGCPDCRREVTELASLRVLLDRDLPAPVLPPGLAERTFAAVEQAAAAASEQAVASTLASAPGGPGRGGRVRRRVPAAAFAAVAGAAALVAGLLMLSRQAAPGREVALVASGGAGAGADAVVRLHREEPGVVVELAVAGLPVPPEGSYYECWYVAEDDSPDQPARLTAGTFTVAAEGTTKVRMTTAASHERYPLIEVTLEPDDGDPRSTGPVVLRSRPRS